MKHKHRESRFLRVGAKVLALMLFAAGLFLLQSAGARAATRQGVVNDGRLNVRTGYGTSYDKLTYNGSNVQLAKGTKVKILDEKDVSGTTWYQIEFAYSGTTLRGYVSGAYVTIGESTDPDPEPIDDIKEITGATAKTSATKYSSGKASTYSWTPKESSGYLSMPRRALPASISARISLLLM